VSIYSLDNHFHKPVKGIKAGIAANESAPSLGGPLHHFRVQNTAPDDRPVKGAAPPVTPITTKRLGP